MMEHKVRDSEEAEDVPWSIHRAVLYWAGLESSIVQWHEHSAVLITTMKAVAESSWNAPTVQTNGDECK